MDLGVDLDGMGIGMDIGLEMGSLRFNLGFLVWMGTTDLDGLRGLISRLHFFFIFCLLSFILLLNQTPQELICILHLLTHLISSPSSSSSSSPNLFFAKHAIPSILTTPYPPLFDTICIFIAIVTMLLVVLSALASLR